MPECSHLDQIQDVKARSVLERLTRFESDASKGQRLWQLDPANLDA